MPNALGRSGLAVVAALVFATVLVALAQSRSKADPLMVFDGVASPIAELSVEIDAGESVTFETAGVSAGADPVLHLLDRAGHQVAVDDNGGTGNAARLVYRSSVDGDYILVLRARTSTSYGTADVLLNGSLWRSDVTFAGWQLELDALRDREAVQAVRVPNGAGPVLELYLLQKSGLGIARRSTGGGVPASLYFATGPGTRIVLLGSSRSEGPVRLFRNDRGIFGHDNDLDGLGKELEADLETCSATTDVVLGIRCDQLADPRDTDGDGLSDGAETLGLRVGSEFLLLPLWGASPRHKDLFIEVDFSRRSKEENAQKVDMKMSPEMARDFAAAYGDVATTDVYLRATHAATLRNPDGLSGISVHLDTGMPPASAGDATIYGNWGGHNAVDAVKEDDEWKGVDYEDAWKEEMTVGRRGFFHHALAYATGGGQTAPGFAATYSIESASIAVHKTGHSLGLGHSGPYGIDVDVNCKPNYPSVMNYAYDDTLMFADGRNSVGPALNNWELRESYAVSPRATALLDALEHRSECLPEWRIRP
jgi:hypothetical protein